MTRTARKSEAIRSLRRLITDRLSASQVWQGLGKIHDPCAISYHSLHLLMFQVSSLNSLLSPPNSWLVFWCHDSNEVPYLEDVY